MYLYLRMGSWEVSLIVVYTWECKGYQENPWNVNSQEQNRGIPLLNSAKL